MGGLSLNMLFDLLKHLIAEYTDNGTCLNYESLIRLWSLSILTF
jgi:hypothetical protein